MRKADQMSLCIPLKNDSVSPDVEVFPPLSKLVRLCN